MQKIGKVIARCFFLVSTVTVTCSFGQVLDQDVILSIEGGGDTPDKMNRDNVPKVVMDNYKLDYPKSAFENWYGYPAFMDDGDWYGYNPYLSSSIYPEYYIAEFTSQNGPQKAIYTKNGRRIATHSPLKTDLPKAVSNALRKGKYRGWRVKKEKEEMTSDSLKTSVYRVVVENKTERHALYYEPNGKLVKDKLLESN